MFSELTKSAKATLYERLDSPFFGALVLVFITRHWRIPAALLAEKPHDALTKAVEAAFHGWTGYRNFGILVVVAMVISLASPWVGLFFASFRARARRLQREAQKKARDKELLSEEQGACLRKENAAMFENLKQERLDRQAVDSELEESKSKELTQFAKTEELINKGAVLVKFEELIRVHYGHHKVDSLMSIAKDQSHAAADISHYIGKQDTIVLRVCAVDHKDGRITPRAPDEILTIKLAQLYLYISPSLRVNIDEETLKNQVVDNYFSGSKISGRDVKIISDCMDELRKRLKGKGLLTEHDAMVRAIA